MMYVNDLKFPTWCEGVEKGGLGGADALVVELQDVGVMHEAVDGGHRGHGVLEDLVPF